MKLIINDKNKRRIEFWTFFCILLCLMFCFILIIGASYQFYLENEKKKVNPVFIEKEVIKYKSVYENKGLLKAIIELEKSYLEEYRKYYHVNLYNLNDNEIKFCYSNIINNLKPKIEDVIYFLNNDRNIDYNLDLDKNLNLQSIQIINDIQNEKKNQNDIQDQNKNDNVNEKKNQNDNQDENKNIDNNKNDNKKVKLMLKPLVNDNQDQNKNINNNKNDSQDYN